MDSFPHHSSSSTATRPRIGPVRRPDDDEVNASDCSKGGDESGSTANDSVSPFKSFRGTVGVLLIAPLKCTAETLSECMIPLFAVLWKLRLVILFKKI